MEKLTGCTGFPLGLAFYALVLLSLSRLIADGRPRRGLVVSLGLGTLGVGFVYPFLFPPVALVCLSACFLAWRHEDTRRRQIGAIGGTLLFCGIAVIPYYRALAVGRAEGVLRIRSQTGPRAVFVDSKLVVPVFGQRALFVALGGDLNLTGYEIDGYALDPKTMLLIVDGYPPALVAERQRIATKLLAGDAVSPEGIASVRAAGDRAFLIGRTALANDRLLAQGAFRIAFKNAAATVWEL